MLYKFKAIAVGILGFCTDSIEGDISIAKVTALIFFLLAVELLLHQMFIEDEILHYMIRIMPVLTASIAGIYGLSVLKRYSTSFSKWKFKDI